MILHLGVLEQAYSDASGSDGTTTTFKVASILEDQFHVMETFVELRREKIAGIIGNSLANSLQNLINGAPKVDTRSTLTYGADQKIETLFRQFIYSNEMSKIYRALTGQALSAAAAAGVNKRKKHPYAQANKARPAFVDTSLFVTSFRCWSTDDASEPTPAAATVGVA